VNKDVCIINTADFQEVNAPIVNCCIKLLTCCQGSRRCVGYLDIAVSQW